MKHAGILVAAALVSHSALADTQLTMSDGAKEHAEHSVISVRNGKVAMQSASDNSLALYDSATGEFTHVDHDKRAYMVMDKQMMDQAAGQMSAMMKQMEAQLASLPAEQREAMMKMMPGIAGRMGAKDAAPQAKIEWTGKDDKVAGYHCKLATITESDGDQSTACVAKPGELGMADKDFEAVASMFRTMQSFAEQFSSEAQMPSVDELGGVPILLKDGHGGKTSRLVKVSTDDLDAGLFSVPDGYTKQSMMGAGR